MLRLAWGVVEPTLFLGLHDYPVVVFPENLGIVFGIHGRRGSSQSDGWPPKIGIGVTGEMARSLKMLAGDLAKGGLVWIAKATRM